MVRQSKSQTEIMNDAISQVINAPSLGRKKRYHTNTDQRNEVRSTYYNGENTRTRTKVNPLTGWDTMSTPSKRGTQRHSASGENPLQESDVLFILFIFGAVGLYLFVGTILWPWINVHMWQITLGIVLLVGLVILALWKYPKFREFMWGIFLTKVRSFLNPPKERVKDNKNHENHTTKKVPPLNQNQRDRLIVKVGNKCEMCPVKSPLEVHHIIPRSEGGSNKETNLIVLCRNCHGLAHQGGIQKSRLKHIVKNRDSSIA